MNNIEHVFVEAETQNIDGAFAHENDKDSIENAFDAERIQEAMMKEADKKAQKLLKKNKRELTRLKNHAGECLLKNNFSGYSYAIKKLRDFYKQPYNDELIKSMWNSSRKALLDIVEKNN